jgi:hypothetical protein
MLIGSATAVLAATLLAIVALDHPYRGIGAIQPVAMERSLETLGQAREVVRDDAPLPCDVQGRPQ